MEQQHRNRTGQVIYLSHGGGPLPFLGDPSHDKMIAFMQDLPAEIPRPEEILVISAHWEEALPTLITAPSPPLLFDYYGFPQKASELEYPIPGNLELAQEIRDLLRKAGIESKETTQRGFDHGVFIPLMLIYPHADIPTTQLSLKQGLNPDEHLKLAEALRSLVKKNILIIGSGFSFHNMREFTWDRSEKIDEANNSFQDWLIEVCTGEMSDLERKDLLREWHAAPHARYCHPREEHLLPLHVCQGIAGSRAELIFDDYILGKRAVAFHWKPYPTPAPP